MSNLANFLTALGGLHDATVVSINWQAEAKVLGLAFDDLYANFRGMPEYPGKRAGTIRLNGVSQVSISIEGQERLRVFEFLPDAHAPDVVIAKFSPWGRLSVKYISAEYPVNELLNVT